MAKNNPYTLTFGKEPLQLISRTVQSDQVISAFTGQPRTQQIYMVTGIRGCGKTVFMTEVARKISANKSWICVELNPERDMLTSLAAKLASENDLARIFKTAKIDLSFFGFGLEVQGTAPITEIESALQKMLASLQKKGKQVLITIDEVTNTPRMREFAAAFQIFVRQNLPVCLLMTGLYENIDALQNENSLTFLYRAPKIELGPLSLTAIARDYQSVLGLPDDQAQNLAKATKGYSFAFQVLGYFMWENANNVEHAQAQSCQYLEDYAYEKIWAELSRKDKQVLHAIVQVKSGKIAEIRENLAMTSNEFNPYRQRLIKRGIISGNDRGYVKVLLPFLDAFVLANYSE